METMNIKLALRQGLLCATIRIYKILDKTIEDSAFIMNLLKYKGTIPSEFLFHGIYHQSKHSVARSGSNICSKDILSKFTYLITNK